jgi:hypothetical protein
LGQPLAAQRADSVAAPDYSGRPDLPKIRPMETRHPKAAGEATRSEILARELVARGLAWRPARALSSRFAVGLPTAQRLGVRRLARELGRLGLDPDQARSTSRTLMALELREHGFTHAGTLEALRADDAADHDVTCAALDAARLHRAMETAREDLPPLWAQATAASIWVAIVTLSVSIAAYLMSAMSA